MGREPLQIVEIVQPRCVLTYGEAPCTAQLGVTGEKKCYNTERTCQDTQNYDDSASLVWRFVRPDANRPLDLFQAAGNDIELNPIPSLASVTASPTRINAGGGDRNYKALGKRASATITLADHAYDDTGSDPYIAERSYIATDRGTFWGKWLARNPFYDGYTLRVYDGYHGQTLAQMQMREYIIDRIEGPDANDRVQIKVLDPLRLADDQRALCPPPFALSLRDAINDTQTTGIVVIGLEDEINTMFGNTGSTKYSRFDDEIIAYTGVTDLGDNEFELTGVIRAQLGTVADSHDVDQQVGRVAHWDDEPVYKIAENLLANFTRVDMGFVPLADWEDEQLDFLGAYSFTGTVAEPTPVIDLLGEISEQSLSYFYWDERAQLIKFKALRPPTETPVFINDRNHIKAGSAQLTVDPEQRISRVVVYYGKRNPTEREDEISNYRRIEVRVDADAERQYDQSRTRTLFSRWLQSQILAQDFTFRILSRYRDSPRFLTLRLDAKDRSLWTADPVDVETRLIQDETGDTPTVRWQVISADEIDSGTTVQYNLQTLEFFGRFAFWMADNAPDFLDLPPDQRDEPGVGFWADTDGLMPDGSDGYSWQ